MKKIAILSFSIFSVLISCKKEDVPTDDAMITNSSFEDNGNFSTDGWNTSNTTSSTEVPAGGGQFSLRIDPATYPSEGYADYIIEDLQGSKILTLTCQINAFDNWPGSIALRKVTAGGVTTILATTGSDDNSWLLKTLEATTSFNSGDKLVVHLSGGSAEVPVASQYILFDIVELSAE